MTTGSTRLGPPLTVSGAALWFGRNFLEALIWASVGAGILVLMLAAYSYPQVAVWTLLCVFATGCFIWSLFGARGERPGSRASVLQFNFFRVTIKVVVGTRNDPQRDRP